MKQVVIVVLTLEDQTFATPLYFFIEINFIGTPSGVHLFDHLLWSIYSCPKRDLKLGLLRMPHDLTI